MKYEVIRYFTDAQDNEYAYHEGDIYPREGHTVSDVRIKDLLSGNNFQQIPLIKRVLNDSVVKVTETKTETKTEVPKEPKVETQDATWTAEDIEKMPFMKLKSVAKQNGIEVEDKKAAEIRSELKEKLGI